MAQAQALVGLHAQACLQATHPPLADETGAPFQAKAHTASSILCGDFNLETGNAEYPLLQAAPAEAGITRLQDAWPLVHGAHTPHAPTFRLHDHRYGPVPISCDFVFVSDDIASRVQRIEVNTVTRASDHQPVVVVLD